MPATHAMKTLEKNGGPINVEQVDWLAEQYQIDVEECIAEINNHEAVKDLRECMKKHSILIQRLNLETYFSILLNSNQQRKLIQVLGQ